MSEESKHQIGTIVGLDLTVPDAPGIRDFYAAVVGWRPEPLSMGDYDDYVMAAPDGTPVAGVCHARGGNTGLPQQWLAYIAVEDLAASLDTCEERGGKILSSPNGSGPGAFAVIQDPSGGVLAIMQRPEG